MNSFSDGMHHKSIFSTPLITAYGRRRTRYRGEVHDLNTLPPQEVAIAATLHDIRTGPQGSSVGAFFDFDGTLLQGFRRSLSGPLTPLRAVRSRTLIWSLLAGLSGRKTTAHLDRIHRLISQVWRGRTEEDFKDIEDRLFSRFIAGHLYPEVCQLIRAHDAAGHTLVIATAAVPFQVRSTARELGIDRILCTETAVSEGILTGGVDGEILWGQRKADAVSGFATANGVELARSYSYSNGASDIPLLSLVGNSIAVNPGRRLSAVADRRGWRVLRLRPRCTAGPHRIVRTILGLLAVLAAAAAAAVCSLGRDRQSAIDRMYVWVSTAALRCAGVRVRITGSEHIRAHRPAVFIFNHQSQIDALIVPYVLRTAFTGVVAMKARRYPIFGSLLRFVGVIFVDRSAPDRAKRTLEPLVTDLQSGRSVAIAPEGRVSPTPHLLPFKKGAFHLAARTGAPIIPIVIRNAGEILWRSSVLVHPGTIDVAVLEPIDISSWNPDAYNQNIEEIRNLYHETLMHWRTSKDSEYSQAHGKP
ncbi:HAD-IB family hydrolase [Nocardia sp. NBC_00881]|uniref:HAD-IB family hydrolase n=1 Tax=Nocardia sp. NBC_00881 TaxID=2975995 RepID=UPI00386CA094|nr:HAD-IB family hydrolase [Nocardia sp. NBC_00881]